MAAAELMTRNGESRALSLRTAGSSTNASFGAVSGVVVEVTQKALDQPGGRAGAVTLSKFSVKSSPHGIGEGVEEGVEVEVEEGVAVGVEEGVAVGGRRRGAGWAKERIPGRDPGPKR